ncbi:MAG: glycosyltransferase family 2 protein, partial [Actinomycetota bacterium]
MSNSLLWLLFAAELVAFVIVAPRLWRSARGAPMLAPTLDQGPTISVIVPARNEAKRIGECLAPLRDAPGVVEVIV